MKTKREIDQMSRSQLIWQLRLITAQTTALHVRFITQAFFLWAMGRGDVAAIDWDEEMTEWREARAQWKAMGIWTPKLVRRLRRWWRERSGIDG